MQRCDTQLCNSEGRVIYRFQASRNLGSSRFNKCWYHILPPVEFTQLSLLVNIIHLHFYFWRKWKYFCVKYRCLCDFCFWCRKSVVAKILGTVIIIKITLPIKKACGQFIECSLVLVSDPYSKMIMCHTSNCFIHRSKYVPKG